MKILRFVVIVLALAGGVVSWLALRVHYSTGTEPCSINERWDCGVVNHSPYAEILHVPVAAMGIVGYLLMAGLAWLWRERLLLLTVIPGFCFALYLTHIEKDVLEVYCLYCVISQGLIALLLLLAATWAWLGRRLEKTKAA